MWNALTPADIAHAKEKLHASRGDILKRHEAELAGLEADAADLDALQRLAGKFARRLKKNMQAAVSPPAVAVQVPVPVAATVTEQPDIAVPLPPAAPPAAHRHAPAHRHVRAAHHDEAEYGHTNFGSFNRALSKQL